MASLPMYHLGNIILLVDLNPINIGYDSSDSMSKQQVTVAKNKLTSTTSSFFDVATNDYVEKSADDKELLTKDGWEIAYVEYPNISGSGGTVYHPGDTFDEVINGDSLYITIKAAAAKKSYDLSTSSKWAALADGEHQVTIVAKGTGYRDSNPSTPVAVTKAAAVTYANVTLDKVDAGGQIQGGSYVSTGYTQISNADTSKYYLIRYLNASSSYATAYLYWDSASAKWKVSNSQSYGFISIVDSKSSSTKIVFCGVDSYEGAWYDWQSCQCLATDVQPESATIPESVFTDNGATTQSLAYYICIKEGTLITLADRTKKPIEDITYDDELLVWNFYKGKFDTAKPCWITKEQTAHEYNLCKFSNGAEVGFIGQGGDIGYHRIYNDEAKAFTHTGVAETPIGTHTFDEYCNTPQLISQQVVTEPVKYYNVGTAKHINLFANGILTSSRISNKYAIENMKYVGPRLISDEEEQAYIAEKLKRS